MNSHLLDVAIVVILVTLIFGGVFCGIYTLFKASEDGMFWILRAYASINLKHDPLTGIVKEELEEIDLKAEVVKYLPTFLPKFV